MTKSDEEYWLALVRAPGVGPISFARLLKHFNTITAVFEADRFIWQQLGLKGESLDYLHNPDWFAVEKDIQWLAQPNNHLVTIQHPDYPNHLREIHDPPPLLFVHGDSSLLSSAQLAMVGTRNPTRQGEEIALEFAQHLSEAGLTVTSGLAIGIDAASHRGALIGSGRTIAVAGTGLDRVYPAQHHQLAHEIAENGALISEFPPGTPTRVENFPRRNRLISGLSLGTLVVEASLRSGSLITARHAVEQGREVFAIPGSIHNPLARGCHSLIKDGAKLVETAADIIEELFHMPLVGQTAMSHLKPIPSKVEASGELLDADYQKLLEYLCAGPVSIDSLVELSGLTAEAVSSMLLILELRGWVASQPGGLYTRLR